MDTGRRRSVSGGGGYLQGDGGGEGLFWVFKGSLSGTARSGRCSCNAEMVESAELLSTLWSRC